MKPKFVHMPWFSRWHVISLTAAVLVSVSSTVVRGQVLYGSIVGNVTDSSGSIVPGATVTITQLETNQTRESVTNEVGGYTFANVAAGTYRVVVALTGFQTFTANGNVVTSSFDADQGMAGGASVNVQVKSGTNRFQALAFEYLTTAALRDRNFFLPADQDKVKDDKNVFGGTAGGPIKKDKLFYFLSVESTVQRSVGGPYATQASGSATQFLSLPPTAIRGGDFSQTGTVIYDPLTGNANGTGRTPFPNSVIPANRINPVARSVLGLLPQPQYPGTANNYFALPTYNSDFHKIDTKVTWNASNKVNVNGRFSYLPAHENAGGLYPGVGQ